MNRNQENSHNSDRREDPRYLDYALDQLSASQRDAVETELERDELTRRSVDEFRRLAGVLKEASDSDDQPLPSPELRKAVLRRLDELEKSRPVKNASQDWWRQLPSRFRGRLFLALAVSVLIVATGVSLLVLPAVQSAREAARRGQAANNLKSVALSMHTYHETHKSLPDDAIFLPDQNGDGSLDMSVSGSRDGKMQVRVYAGTEVGHFRSDLDVDFDVDGKSVNGNREQWGRNIAQQQKALSELNEKYAAEVNRLRQLKSTASQQGQSERSSAWVDANEGAKEQRELTREYVKEIEKIVRLQEGLKELNARRTKLSSAIEGESTSLELMVTPHIIVSEEEELQDLEMLLEAGGETYEPIVENAFIPVVGQAALSTFSIDVDTASYSNVRRFLNQGALPPSGAVRVEEMLNYFAYDYPQPQAGEPFSVTMEMADCPWQPKHKLLRIGLKGREIPREKRPPSNLVFLIDVSGSMADANKLPLLKEAMNLLIGQLDERDRVTIVTYAGDAGLRLDRTYGDQQQQLRAAIDSLQAGGSTHGSAGIQLAYEKATESLIDEGTNRVILATDGDLNVGITGDDALVDLIKDKAATGVFLTVLGFGTGNLKDAKLEKLADNGNGMYAYVDDLREGRKVLVEQISASLVTIAKDVKIQLEFNPAAVAAYRQIGYENRVLAAEEFDDDTKDAGEIGAGHSVTALYELLPAGDEPFEGQADQEAGQSLKYQRLSEKPDAHSLTPAAGEGDLLTIWLRYKQPDGHQSQRIEFTLKNSETKFSHASKDFQFAAAVASFGMLLRGSQYGGNATFAAIEEIASAVVGDDPQGYRTEFLDLVRRAEQLQP